MGLSTPTGREERHLEVAGGGWLNDTEMEGVGRGHRGRNNYVIQVSSLSILWSFRTELD